MKTTKNFRCFFLLHFRDCNRKTSSKQNLDVLLLPFLSFQKVLLRQSDAMKVWFRFVFSRHISNCVRTQWSRIGKCCPCSRLPRSSHFCGSEHFCSSKPVASCSLSASSNLFHSLFSIKWTTEVMDYIQCAQLVSEYYVNEQ